MVSLREGFCYIPTMTRAQWASFSEFKTSFLKQCELWLSDAGGNEGWLSSLQRTAAVTDGTPSYPIETPVVYNRAIDDVGEQDSIRLIIVGDNPGKNEQLAQNSRYLVGQAGKLGAGFFRNYPELGIDFRKDVLILNKTPLHSAKTKQLSSIVRAGGEKATELFERSQKWMARETALLQKTFDCPLWLVGYGELRAKGLFSVYAQELAAQYSNTGSQASVYLYQHFSMNRFSIDFKKRYDSKKTVEKNLEDIGREHRMEILGW